MKFTSIMLASLLMTVCSSYADDTHPNILNFTNVPASVVLSVYIRTSHLEFIVDSRAKAVSTPITLHNPSASTVDESLKVLETALLTQAGILITRLDGKRASVTFNDALPITR